MSYLPVIIIYILAFLVLMIFRFIQQPYSPANIHTPALESLATIVGGIALGVLIYLFMRMFQGNDLAPDLSTTTTYSVVGLAIVYMLHHLIT